MDRPPDLARQYGAQFEDRSVASSYHHRPPYVREAFDLLLELMPSGPRHVLDLGCGTGDLSLRLGDRLGGVDAIDAELTGLGLFHEVGRHTTSPVPWEQSVSGIVESMHTRNGFSRERMEPAAAAEFDEALRAMVRLHAPGGIYRGLVRTEVIWGEPRAPA